MSGGGGLGTVSEDGPSQVACFVVVPLAALLADWFDKLYVVFTYDAIELRLWRRVAGFCGCLK
jgi:hypothetical protein